MSFKTQSVEMLIFSCGGRFASYQMSYLVCGRQVPMPHVNKAGLLFHVCVTELYSLSRVLPSCHFPVLPLNGDTTNYCESFQTDEHSCVCSGTFP
jgi:hypothetical protein